jgi:integrase
MPRGAAVVRYRGRRGVVWRIKYRDAAGKQLMETLGPEPPWNERKAMRELGKRLAAVDDGYRKPERMNFTEFVRRYTEEYLPGRNLKPTTIENYGRDLRCHLVPFFGDLPLGKLEADPGLIDAYVALKASEGLAPKTINNHLLLLNVMLRRAIAWRLIRTNPVAHVDRPRLEMPEVTVLTEAEIARLTTAYGELELDAPSESERAWWRLARSITIVILGTALRRGEILGLRWRDVNLLERWISVRQTYVRGRFTTPKSKASRRAVEFGPRTLAALEEHWQQALHRDDDDLVFGHPELGTPLDPGKLARRHMKPALRRAGIDKPFASFHGLRHTSLTHAAAAGNPQIYVQMRAGHSHGSITERYMHAAQILFPGAAEKSETRMFGSPSEASG